MGGAEDFHIRGGDTICGQACADGAQGEVGGVAVAGEMTKDGAAQAVLGERGKDFGGGDVGEVAVARHDALFQGPGTAGIVPEEFFVVIGLDDDSGGSAEALVDEFGGKTEIRAKAEAGPIVMQDETGGLVGVMRDGECLDGEVADREVGTGKEQAKIFAVVAAARTLDGFGGKGVAEDRGLEFFAKDIKAADMVAVLVRDEDGVDGRGVDGCGGEPAANLPRTEAAIDEKAAGRGLDKGAVSRAARAEDGHSEHEEMNAPMGGGEAR